MPSSDDQLPVWLAGQPAKPLPSAPLLSSYGNVLRMAARLVDAIAQIPDAASRARLQVKLDEQNGFIVWFEEQYGRWTLPGVPFTPPPVAPAMQQPAAPAVPINSKPKPAAPAMSKMPKSTSTPNAPASGTPPQSARGGLNKSMFSQVAANANATGGPIGVGVPKVSQVPARTQGGEMRMVVEWKTLANNDDPRADVLQTEQTFAVVSELAKSCTPTRLAYYRSIMPAIFRYFRGVQISDTLQYDHNDGKVSPCQYDAEPEAELWLCFVTFCTFEVCLHGALCRYRHMMLTLHEIVWISRSAQGQKYLETTYFKYWNAKGGKQPVHQPKALPVPGSKQVPQSAAGGLTGSALPLRGASDHPKNAANADNAAAAELMKEAEDAEKEEARRQRLKNRELAKRLRGFR